MIEDDEDVIALAVKRLDTAIDKLLTRRKQTSNEKLHRRLRRLVDHARHIFKELFSKRRNLKALLLWFRKEWIRIEVNLGEKPVEILQHAMQYFLRCQDAFILLTSGECRHEYDMKLAKTTKFRSRLSTLQERDDGYTILYKGTGIYSGYGFDEFNNEVVGIRALLVNELKRHHKSPWDYLERQGGTELVESLLDRHEREAKELQHSLQLLKQRMMEDINKRLNPTNLKFATQDKMERLSLSAKGRKIHFERRAGSFQIEGPLLPDEKRQPEDWNCCSLKIQIETENAYPPSKIKKRRRVIDDSDSEDETSGVCGESDTISNKSSKQIVGKSSGLVVRIDTSCRNTEKEHSLAVIKNQLGVNTHDLEQAREILEGEDANTMRIFEQEKVVRLEKILNRVLTRDEMDENEVWDARECLRYACMEAGNKYLWDTHVRCVDKAIENFEKAREIVELQQKSQHDSPGSDSALLVQSNLLYLHGQAVVNIGISLVDSCHRKISTPRAKILRAIEELRRVQSTMGKLRDSASRMAPTSNLDSTSYILKSMQLESLAYRWMGKGLWLISQEKKSIAMFERASKTYNDPTLQNALNNSDFREGIFEVAAEAIYATCDVADRCSSRMEESEYKSSILQKKHNEMRDILSRALTRHIEINESIERNYSSLEGKLFRSEYDISSIEDVRLYHDEIIKRWDDFVNQKPRSEPFIQGRRPVIGNRSDIASSTNVVLTPDEPFTNIFSSDHGKRRRYRSHRKGTMMTNGYKANQQRHTSTNTDAAYALSSEGLHQKPLPPTKFRKWGDEILIAEQHKSQKANSGGGEYCSSTLVLTYPSIAPPNPIDYQ